MSVANLHASSLANPVHDSISTYQRRTLGAILLVFLVTLFFSRSAAEISVWCMFVGWIAVLATNCYRGRRLNVSQIAVGCDKLLLLLFSAVCLSTLVRVPDLADRWSVMRELRVIAILYPMAYIVRLNFNQRSEKVLIAFSLVFIVVGVNAVFQHFTGIDLVRSHNDSLRPLGAATYRATGFLSSPLNFAHSFGFLGTIYIVWYMLRRQQLPVGTQLLGAFAVAGILLGVLVSGSRGAWLASAVTILALLPFLKRRTAVSLMVCTVAAASLILICSTSIRNRTIRIFDVQEYSNVGRLNLWRANWEVIKDFPILGVGLGQTSQHVGKYYEELNISNGMHVHSHNNLVEFLAGTGIIGLLSYLLVCFYFLAVSLRVYRRCSRAETQPGFVGSLALGCFAAQTYIHGCGMTDFNFSMVVVKYAMGFVWAVTIGLEFATRDLESKRQSYSDPKALA
ncbi:MAG: O-antigen ligase family protein [Pirellulaceae bacterium]